MTQWSDPMCGCGDELSLGHRKLELLWVIWVEPSSGQLDIQVGWEAEALLETEVLESPG